MFRGFLWIALTVCTLLLVGCSSHPESLQNREVLISKSDSIQVVGRFINLYDEPSYSTDSVIKSAIDSICAGNDQIYLYSIGDYPRAEYLVRLEKVKRDSSWFVLRTIRYKRNSLQSKSQKTWATDSNVWERRLRDSIADTTEYFRIETALESFAPETTMVKRYAMYDGNLWGIFYKKDNRCMASQVDGLYSFLGDSPSLKKIYVDLKTWTRKDYFLLRLMPDSNVVYVKSNLKEPVICRVVDNNLHRIKGVDSLVFKFGEQKAMFDFSRFNSNDKLLCESEAGFIRDVWVLKE